MMIMESVHFELDCVILLDLDKSIADVIAGIEFSCMS